MRRFCSWWDEYLAIWLAKWRKTFQFFILWFCCIIKKRTIFIINGDHFYYLLWINSVNLLMVKHIIKFEFMICTTIFAAINPASTCIVYSRNLNLIIITPVDVLTPIGARPLVSALITLKLDGIFFFKISVSIDDLGSGLSAQETIFTEGCPDFAKPRVISGVLHTSANFCNCHSPNTYLTHARMRTHRPPAYLSHCTAHKAITFRSITL